MRWGVHSRSNPSSTKAKSCADSSSGRWWLSSCVGLSSCVMVPILCILPSGRCRYHPASADNQSTHRHDEEESDPHDRRQKREPGELVGVGAPRPGGTPMCLQLKHRTWGGREQEPRQHVGEGGLRPVSYTHLTLPTIL